METVKISSLEEFSVEKYLKVNPFKTDKIIFNVYNFKPWQALHMHKHPDNDEVFYVVDGEGIFIVHDEERSISENSAIYVPANTLHSILAGENDLVIISVQGPTPVGSMLMDNFRYGCPVCSLDTPVTINTYDGCLTVCPRCNIKLKLKKIDGRFEAEETKESPPTIAWV
ncbi:hypothetical protein CUJ83_09950 [Methanocella sp. CWC-04]|uniref:Cupin type-2 domain-containing protein n=1 Tax=Methanooceanicella nereidis TaxID=2052831 RepID=A0AAP2RFM3_9EURY|nr:cupin domain-containing protein [Methanocella sp. CWC-04]MCD1295322.1 hypothetical protein [Methanocella sp. CWC-04]